MIHTSHLTDFATSIITYTYIYTSHILTLYKYHRSALQRSALKDLSIFKSVVFLMWWSRWQSACTTCETVFETNQWHRKQYFVCDQWLCSTANLQKCARWSIINAQTVLMLPRQPDDVNFRDLRESPTQTVRAITGTHRIIYFT